MRNISSAWKQKAKYDYDIIHYLKYIDFTLADGTTLSVDNSDLWEKGFKFDESVSQDDSFDIGTAIINTATVTLNNFEDKFTDYNFEGARAVCYIGLEVPNDLSKIVNEKSVRLVTEDGKVIIAKRSASSVTEKIRICTMTVTEAPYQNTVLINLTMEDYMRKFDRDYSESKLSYPATRSQIIRDACDVCGVTLQTTTFDLEDYMIQKRPDDTSLTFRQVVSWVAMIGCQWARCDEYGRLCLGWYNTEPEDSEYIDIETTSGLTVNLEDVVITGVRVTEYNSGSGSDTTESEDESASETVEAGTYLAGAEGYVIEITDNQLIGIGYGEEIAAQIGARVIGMRFRPFSAGILTDVSIEAGDPVRITSAKGETYTSFLTSVTLQPGEYESISNNAKNATRNSATQYSQMTQIAVEARKNYERERTAREKALEQLAIRIAESSGVYTTVEVQADGSSIYYLHDKPLLSESSIVWKMTAEAWGVSTDGGKTWNAGMTVDGDTIVRLLTATGVSADWIDTGELIVREGGKANGEILFRANVDTGAVEINATKFKLAGKTIGEIADESASAAVDDYDSSLNQLKVFNKLTNNGATQGIYLENGKLYINGEYVNAKGLSVKDASGNTTFYVDKDGNVQILASEFSLSGKTIGEIADDSASTAADSALSNAKSYTDSATSSAIDNYDDTLNQTEIFNKLTNNGASQGITLSNGQLYVNGQYINAKNLSVTDASGNTTLKVDSNGNVSIRAVSFTLAGQSVNDIANSAANSALASAKSYTDTSSSNTLDSAKTYTDGKLIGLNSNMLKGFNFTSDDISTYWDTSGTVTVGQSDPVGGTNAVQLYVNNTDCFLSAKESNNKTIYTTGQYTFSVWLKASKSVTIKLGFNRNWSDDYKCALTTSWQKFTFYVNISSIATSGQLFCIGGYGNITNSSGAYYVYAYHPEVKYDYTQDEYFNRLTNNGAVNGLYMGDDGNMYISFTYAKGGTLKLGGTNNQNGSMVVYDKDGNMVFSVNNEYIQSKYGDEWLRIKESLLRGGHRVLGDITDGILDLSQKDSEYSGRYNVVLEAVTGSANLKAAKGFNVELNNGSVGNIVFSTNEPNDFLENYFSQNGNDDIIFLMDYNEPQAVVGMFYYRDQITGSKTKPTLGIVTADGTVHNLSLDN